jgi:hypothetical protein
MGERAGDGASKRKLQTSPGLSLIGCEVYFFKEKGSDVDSSRNGSFLVSYIRKGSW